MPGKKRIFFRNMAKIAHGVSVALGLAVACIHALCGAEKPETRAGAYSGDAFLPGVLRTADACVRPEDQRKNRARERIARAQKSEKQAAQHSSQTEFFCAAPFPRISGPRADFCETVRGRIESFPFSPKFFRRANPIRAPSAA